MKRKTSHVQLHFTYASCFCVSRGADSLRGSARAAELKLAEIRGRLLARLMPQKRACSPASVLRDFLFPITSSYFCRESKI